MSLLEHFQFEKQAIGPIRAMPRMAYGGPKMARPMPRPAPRPMAPRPAPAAFGAGMEQASFGAGLHSPVINAPQKPAGMMNWLQTNTGRVGAGISGGYQNYLKPAMGRVGGWMANHPMTAQTLATPLTFAGTSALMNSMLSDEPTQQINDPSMIYPYLMGGNGAQPGFLPQAYGNYNPQLAPIYQMLANQNPGIPGIG